MTAKTRDYYVNLGKADAQANKPSTNTFKAGSWQACAYDYGFMAGSRDVPQSAQEAKPAPAKAQAGMIPEEDKSPYLRSLQAQRKALRLKHGIKRQGGEVCQWQTSRRLRPQVAKQLAKLDALIQVATRGWHEGRVNLETTASYSGRPYSYSTAKLYKQGKYGHNLLGSE